VGVEVDRIPGQEKRIPYLIVVKNPLDLSPKVCYYSPAYRGTVLCREREALLFMACLISASNWARPFFTVSPLWITGFFYSVLRRGLMDPMRSCSTSNARIACITNPTRCGLPWITVASIMCSAWSSNLLMVSLQRVFTVCNNSTVLHRIVARITIPP